MMSGAHHSFEFLLLSFLDKTCSKDSFYRPRQFVDLDGKVSSQVDIDFLPLFVGQHNCFVLFNNETIGQFVYAVLAKATLPLPSPVYKSHWNTDGSSSNIGRKRYNILKVCVHCILVRFTGDLYVYCFVVQVILAFSGSQPPL